MFKERYEKPVVKPAECTDGLLREKYQKPDMELVDLGVVAIIASSVPDSGTNTDPQPTVAPSPQPTVTPSPQPTRTPSMA